MPEARKTYWHLAGARRCRPTTRLRPRTALLRRTRLRGRRAARPTGTGATRQGSTLVCDDWDRFADPRETTYAKYVDLQQAKETHVDGLLRSIEDSDYDQQAGSGLGRHAGAAAAAAAPPLSRAADAGRVRRPDGAERAHHDRRGAAGGRRDAPGPPPRLPDGAAAPAATRISATRASSSGKPIPAWQPLRELIERLLVTYDWGEAFAALNLGAKPVLDAFFLGDVADPGARPGRLPAGRDLLLAGRGRRLASGLVAGARGAGGVRRCRQPRPAGGAGRARGAPPRPHAVAPLARELGVAR